MCASSTLMSDQEISAEKLHKDISMQKYISRERLKDLSVENASTSSICSSEPYGSSFVEQKQQIIESNWGGYALNLNLWDDSESPVVRPSELTFDRKESSGFLSDRLIGLAASFLTRSPENGLYVLGKCVLRNENLTDISMLQHHRHLQYIDVDSNNISDLSPLSSLSYLMYLNASRNNINCISNFTPPWYLTCVNLSYNHMTDIGDLRNCWSIVRLNLSHNVIETISGLENLKHLQYLDLSYNLIECVRNLDDMNIQELNLEGNCITSFRSAISGRGINILTNLRTIMLGYNKLSTLTFFKDAYNLRYVDLRYNRIADLLEVLNLKGSIFEVDFTGNACTKWPNYRNVLISSIPSIKFIDGIDVLATEKVMSAMLFASPLDLTAARKVAKLMLLEQLNIIKIDPHVQPPYDEVGPPLIALTGPSAMKKLALALHVVRTIPDKIKYCPWHSTKEIYEDDDERDAYILVSREDFNDMARRGEFLVILDLLGHSYGFHIDQIVLLMSQHKVGITQMNLYAVTEISRRYPNIRAILSFTQSRNLHKQWIEEKFDVYTWIKDSMEDLLVVKIGKHRREAETASSVLNFIEEILHEIIGRLELPSYSIHVRPQGTGATTTDIILESKTMLPRVTIRRSELRPSRKNRTSLKERNEEQNNERNRKSVDRLLYENKYKMEELRVILDEESNIIIDDEETKRELRRSRMLERRSTLILNGFDDVDKNDLTDSTSSDEEMETVMDARKKEILDEEKARALKNTYSELVIKSRKLYLDYHESHPGFFAFVLLMDDYTKAFNTLNDFIHQLNTGQPYRQPAFLSIINQFTQAAIPAALENILDEIQENLSTSKLQRKTMLKIRGGASEKFGR